MKAKYILPLFLAVTASAALGHGGVLNAAVLARMEAMKAIGDATKVLGEMAKGAVAFDANAARAAAETIATHAADTPALFEAREADPKSEAKPGIWENFADFTAKAGDLGFTKALAQEGARAGITVNAVCPGYIATDMVMAVPEKVREQIIAQIPVGRLGEADEIARCVVFLASDAAGFITGSTISANGGQFFV